jgi:hypothetical protein
MRFPSLIKLPKYRRYSYTPRLYDPIAEDIAERRKKVEAELRAEAGEVPDHDHESRIRGSFRSRTAHQQEDLRSRIGSLFFVTILLGTLYAYWFMDGMENYVLGFGGALSLAYFWWRLRQR